MMIPSINALKHVSLVLRENEQKFRVTSHRARHVDNEPELANKYLELADDYHQVASFLEDQVKLRTIEPAVVKDDTNA